MSSSTPAIPPQGTPSTERYRPSHSDDPGWDYGQPHEGNVGHIVCDFCGHLSKGGIRRFKHHLVKKSYLGTKDEATYKDVAPCDKVPDNVVKMMREFMEGKAKKADARKKVRDEMFKNINVYGVGDDDEDGAQNLPKRVKGPIQKFLVPMEGPKFPTNKENKKALENIHGYIGDFFYENGISFNCAKLASYNKMWAAAVQYNDPSTFKPPSYEDLRVKILKKKKDSIGEWLGCFQDHWETYGVTIMTDWWTDGKGRTLINFLVNCPKGTVFLKSIDGSEHVHDAKLIYDMLKDVIVAVGENNVIQVCTDNATNYKLAGDWLMEDSKIFWMPCGAHCVNLALKDVGNLPMVQSVVLDAQAVSVFIYNHKHVLRLMREETKGREIVRPSITRFATNFLCLQSMYEKRQQLRDMIHTQKWRNNKWPKHPSAKEIVKIIKSNTFWNNMHYCLKIMAPLVDVLRMVDTEEKPSMPYIYKAIEICKAKVKANIGEQTQEDREMWKKVERIIDSRWTDMLKKPLHLAAHYLNPQYYYATPTSGRDMEANTVVKEGLLNCIEKLAMDQVDEQQILLDLGMYRHKKGRFGRDTPQSCIKTLAPGEWWETFGSEVPALQRFSRRVLSLTSSASPCERNWSTFSNIHSKKRNCLEHERLEDLAYVQYNMRLKQRYEERMMNGKDIDPLELKIFDECVEWLISKDARDDIVLGTDGMTFGVLEEAEDGSNDPPTTRQSRRDNATSQGGGSTRRQNSHFPIDDDSSSGEDENDGDEDYNGDSFEDDDGISSGDDEDLP